jgi:tetratricopeptide (TPR) repeat protein
LALDALSSGRTEAALPLLRQCLDVGEEVALAGLNLGMALADLGRLAEAAPHLKAARQALPHMAEPRFRLGQIAAQQRHLGEARAAFEGALAVEPDHVMSMAGLAALAEAEGDPDSARPWVAQALLLAPDDPGLLLMQARLAGDAASCRLLLTRRLGGVEAARLAARCLGRDALREEVAAAPLEWRWQAALGLAELAAGEAEAGLATLRLACILADDTPALQGLLGLQLAEQRRHAEAAPLLEAAIAANPADAQLRSQHGITLLRLHRLGAARAALESAIADFGPQSSLLCNLALTLTAQGLQEEALQACESAGGDVLALGCRMGVQPYHPAAGNAAALHRTATRLGAGLPRAAVLPHPPGFDPARRLRVGFLSASFGRHPVGWLTLSAIEALPPVEIEVACFSLKPMGDALARRFHARADLWRELPRLDDAGLAAAIRADMPDILVDLGGHGEGGRVSALAHRAAPVQVKWVGAQSATTGVPGMDWMLSDAWETPPGSEAHYTERLLRMPDGYACYTAPPWAPPVAELPALDRGHVTFGCFNNLAKITPEVLAAWARILAALPSARLVLRTHALGDAPTRALFLNRAAAAGLPVERLELHGPTMHEALLGAYNDIDVALDPFPYAGGLTACEALWMGVPLIALAGSSFAGRHAVSHLNNIGLGHWVAGDVEGYVARGIAAGHEVAALARLRAGLRADMAASPLMDAPRFAGNLAKALRAVWRHHCAQARFA